MTLSYGQYTITGTVDEIKEFIIKMTPTTVGNTTTAIIKESDDGSLPTLKTIKCPNCNSKHITLYNNVYYENNKKFVKCNDCGKFFEIEVEV